MHVGANVGREQEGSEVLAQAAQRAGGAALLEAVKARLDGPWGLELEGSVRTYSKGLELGDLKGSPQPKPFHDSMILF